MSRKTATALIILGILGGAFLAGFLAMAVAGRGFWGAARRGADVPLAAVEGGGGPWPADGARRSGGTGYVVLAAAMAAHPSWSELVELTAEVEREQQSLAAERAAAAAIAREAGAAGDGVRQVAAAIGQAQQHGQEETREALQAAYARRWEAERARLEAEAQRKVAERRAVLAAQVDEQVGVKRGEVKAALADRIDQIRRRREARLLSLQFQLGLKDKDPAMAARAEALQDEVRQVRAEIEQEVKAAQEGAERELGAFAREAEEAARRDLEAYAAEQAAETTREAEALRQQLEAELARRLPEMGSRGRLSALPGPGAAVRPGPGGRPGAAAPTPLQLRRNALQARIMADVRRVAAEVARTYGLGEPQLVGARAERPTAGVDLTGAVVEALMR